MLKLFLAVALVLGPDGTTPLHWAVHNNDVAAVDRLIKSGADVNAKNDYGSTPILEAVEPGNAVILEKLLKAGANPNSPGADGMTPLMIVARNTNTKLAKLLLDNGANPNAVEQQRKQTALMWASAQNRREW
jgi:ankyrin repeat protein